MKRVIAALMIAALSAVCVFACAVQWAMTHAEVCQNSTGISLYLFGHEWVHELDCGIDATSGGHVGMP